ncbi:glycine-rich protein-like [Argiope bruennichi]|uniref:glycine-rich protein-like n=1 Tax=Argiope bruennichi TaxID=94029 RepID=UPI0024959383|nr:glycine-rich protein-like [Argiope bruennichi]
MFRLAVFACIALCLVQGSFLPAQPYDYGYAVNNLFSHQYKQEAGNGVGGVVGRYGTVDARGNFQYRNYASGAGYPIYGYGLNGYGLRYDGYGLPYGAYGNLGYGYGGVLGHPALI